MAQVTDVERKSDVLKRPSLPCLSEYHTINLAAGCPYKCRYCYAQSFRSNPGQGFTQPGPLKLKGKMGVRKGVDFVAVHFRSKGKVTFNIFTPWVDPSDHQTQTSYVGMQPRIAIDGKSITLDPLDPSIQRTVDLPDKGVIIKYDPAEGVWELRSSLPGMVFQPSIQPHQCQPTKSGRANARCANASDASARAS